MAYRNFDSQKMPQQVHITWERRLIDDESGDGPDDNDEGFWPSKDPNACGYCGERTDEEFDELWSTAKARYDGFGDWWGFVGVVAVAHIAVPIGGGSFSMFELTSPGLWGVESDAGDYLDDVFEEEKANLLGMIETMGMAVHDKTVIEKEG